MVGGIGGGGGPTGPGKIGGPGAPVPSAPAAGAQKASFGEALGTKKVEGASGPSPLEQLRAGEIDRQGYVELRVREATAHLEGVLSPADLEKVQEQLRDVIENDPDLAALVKAAEVGS